VRCARRWRRWLWGDPRDVPLRRAQRGFSVAVLPLVDLSHDDNQAYFADGMTEALITDLAKIRALKVISRTSAMRYKVPTSPCPRSPASLA
jgi:TolB-like protein